MKYYLIAGEASGDLHASRLMNSLKDSDSSADFRFFGGDQMSAVGGTLVKHYREMAYMGFIPVLRHLPTILHNMEMCKQDILEWQPDVVILVDYPGFNLDIAKFVKERRICPVYYYISPKIWAWKEYRIKRIKRDVDELFSILPFEVDFFEEKHHYPIHYVGNPTMNEVDEFRKAWPSLREKFYQQNALAQEKPIIALLCGSRKQEIKDNLPPMLKAVEDFSDRYAVVVAGAPSIDKDYYQPFLAGHRMKIVYDQTYSLLSEAKVALVTSGTATLETALFGVPQVVCYKTPLPKLIGWMRQRVLNVKYVSLVNLIAVREVVTELVADTFSVENIKAELLKILDDGRRAQIQDGYAEVRRILGEENAPENAANIMYNLLNNQSK